jgi:hypothetical protein
MLRAVLVMGAIFYMAGALIAAPPKKNDISLDGFIKAATIFSDAPMASYRNINLTAPTHALPHSVIREQGSRLSFQTQQTRFGIGIAKAPTTGRLEFDFVDFSKASPTTQMVPRVRVASITHHWDHNTVIVGQDWDFFSPVTGMSFNHIGNYFLAGNTGFMRPQLILMRLQNNLEVGGAVGLVAANPGQVDTNIERGKSPSYSFSLGHRRNDFRLGLSLIYATLSFYEDVQLRRDAYGQNLYFEKKFTRGELRAEVYYGQNLANLGTLSLGWGDNEIQVREFGGFISGLFSLSDKHSLLGGIGMARIDNRTSLRPFSVSSNELIDDLGIWENLVMRIAHKFLINEHISWYTEVTRFNTVIKMNQLAYKRIHAHTFETGLQLRF